MVERSHSRAGIGTGVTSTPTRTALAVLALLSPGMAVALLYGSGSGSGSPAGSCHPQPAAPSPVPFALRPDRMGAGRDDPAAGSVNNVANGTPKTAAKASSVETVTFSEPRSTRPTYDRSMPLASASPSWLRPRSTRRRRRFQPISWRAVSAVAEGGDGTVPGEAAGWVGSSFELVESGAMHVREDPRSSLTIDGLTVPQ